MIIKKWCIQSFAAIVLCSASLVQSAAPFIEADPKKNAVRLEEDEKEKAFADSIYSLPDELIAKILAFAEPATVCDKHVEKIVAQLVCEHASLMSIDFKGRYLVTKHHDTLRIWDISDNGQLLETMQHRCPISNLQISSDKALVVAYGDNGQGVDSDHGTQIWNTALGSLRYDLVASPAPLMISPDNTYTISVTRGNALVVKDIASGEILQALLLNAHKSDVRSVAISPCSTRIAIRLDRFPIPAETRIFDRRTGELVSRFINGYAHSWDSMNFNHNGKLLAIGDAEIHEVDSGNLLYNFVDNDFKMANDCKSSTFCRNNLLVAASNAGIQIRDIFSKKLQRQFTFKKKGPRINQVALSADNARLVTKNNWDEVRVWKPVSPLAAYAKAVSKRLQESK